MSRVAATPLQQAHLRPSAVAVAALFTWERQLPQSTQALSKTHRSRNDWEWVLDRKLQRRL